MHEAIMNLGGHDYVIVTRREYDRLSRLAKAAALPPMPKPDAEGNYPAVEFGRASMARKIIRGRVEAGLTQAQLAKLAGIRSETLCRLERGQHTPSAATVLRIEQALKRAASGTRSRERSL